MKITRRWLRTKVEQPEPSIYGEWYVLDLEALRAEGFRYMEVHLNGGETDINQVNLTTDYVPKDMTPKPKTKVKLTPEVMARFNSAWWTKSNKDAVIDILEALGFEVES